MKTFETEQPLCPVNDWNCPYCVKCECQLDHPEEECDDYYGAVGDDYDEDLEMGFNPYEGAYDYDC